MREEFYDETDADGYRSRTFDVPVEENGHRLWRRGKVTLLGITGPDYPSEILSVLAERWPCDLCGQFPKLELTADLARAVDACPTPDGHTSVITLNVPSGQILVTDDLRPVYRIDDDLARAFAPYDSSAGQTQYIRAMADLGCAYGPVGNSCPSLYRTGNDTYIIARRRWDDETGDEVTPDGWTELANVCTDLWAYSIADYADWQARGGDPATLGWTDTVVDVPPGTYEFTHHFGEASFDDDADGAIYAHIRRLP